MNIETTSCVRDDATGTYTQTITLKVDTSDLDRMVLAATGFDGLGDPTTSKGLQQVVFKDGTFVIVTYTTACEMAMLDADYVTMIDVASLRNELRKAFN